METTYLASNNNQIIQMVIITNITVVIIIIIIIIYHVTYSPFYSYSVYTYLFDLYSSSPMVEIRLYLTFWSHCPVENCMIPPNTITEAVFLRPRARSKLAAFNVRTLMQVRQQIGLAMSLESLNIEVCCLSQTRIQDSGEVLQIRSPSVACKSLFYVRLSGDAMASSSGLADIGVALTARAEAALIDWIPINSRLRAVRLESSIKVGCQSLTSIDVLDDGQNFSKGSSTGLLLRQHRSDCPILHGR
ncbi:unnamed protein product [Schistosoma haematobium]|nr:unnamed protein product [Schistosoma haematobium]